MQWHLKENTSDLVQKDILVDKEYFTVNDN